MNEDFVPYELAVKLAENGFNEPCNAYYEPINLNLNFCKLGWRNSLEKQLGVITAPTISQVLKWLRKEEKIHITIDIWGRTWGYDILALPSGRSLHRTAYDEKINSYEQAALAGIEYYLDNFICYERKRKETCNRLV